jgi:Zn-dependent protease
VSIDRWTLIWFVALIVAVILHEISHGVVALWFGDDTARRAGRLTLNPVPHIDPLGSVIMPALGALSGVPVIAWAKPVPVNPGRLRHRRRDMLIVSLAGPATNLMLMFIAALMTRTFLRGHAYGSVAELPLPVAFAFAFALVNLFLGIFNLLPIPPLDGSSIVETFLPARHLAAWYRFRQYGILILFLMVIYTGWLDRLFAPFRDWLLRFIAS